MDYKAHYDRLIETRRELKRERGEQYYESHHIVPRSEGGTDDESNLILLTAKEHYVAHLLLWKAEPENRLRMHAVWMMGNMTSSFSSRMYEAVKYELFGDGFNLKEYVNLNRDSRNKYSRERWHRLMDDSESRQKIEEYFKNYFQEVTKNDPDYRKKANEAHHNWRQNNKEYIRKYLKMRREEKSKNPEYIKQRREKNKAYILKKYHEDPEWREKQLQRNREYRARKKKEQQGGVD